MPGGLLGGGGGGGGTEGRDRCKVRSGEVGLELMLGGPMYDEFQCIIAGDHVGPPS